MTKTANYELNKPGYADPVNIDDLNANFDTIDEQMKNNFDLASSKQDKAAGKGLSTNDYTNADKAKVAALGALGTVYSGVLPAEDNYELGVESGVYIVIISSVASSSDAGLYIVESEPSAAQVSAVLSSAAATVATAYNVITITNNSTADSLSVTVLRIS